MKQSLLGGVLPYLEGVKTVQARINIGFLTMTRAILIHIEDESWPCSIYRKSADTEKYFIV